jgi:tetratricopeptide (TPR) repeat protein
MSTRAFGYSALVAFALLGSGCGEGSGTAPPAAQSQGLFGNLGPHHRTITTSSAEAQRYFDEGLVLVFAFNHDEAIRSFAEAARLDPSAAMPHWGIALANGPHINNAGMDDAHSRAAWQALAQARSLAAGASPIERTLIDALAARYAETPPADRKPLDEAYASAMREVWKAHPDDADIGALFAEAMMDLRPWDLWLPDGTAQPGTEEILATLDAVLSLAPDHPLANHLQVHALEGSPHPERALASADRLRTLVPGAGHLVHMPAHIYSRVGRWKDAADQNVAAIQVDDAYRAKSPKQNFYHVYMAHNHHFLTWASMMEGRSADALRSARAMLAGMPPEFVREMSLFADGYQGIELEALMRFGRWDEILNVPEPPAHLPITAALRRFARGVSLTALNRVEEAEAESRAFADARSRVTDDMFVGNNPASAVLAIAEKVLAGELDARKGNTDAAVAALREAAKLEDALRYNEAPDWLQPVRHALGAVLIKAKRHADAEAVYRDDLARNPENGWSLHGLAQCLRARKADAEAAEVEARFEKAWARADVPLTLSCFCQEG